MALFYLYVSDQQCEEHQATEDIDYAEYHLNTIACRGQIVTKSTAKQGIVQVYQYSVVEHNTATAIKKYVNKYMHGTRLEFF